MLKQMDVNNDWLDLAYFCKYYKIHIMTAYRLAKEGKIPAVKVGGQWRVHKSNLEEGTK